MDEKLKEKLVQIKLLVLDVDGVLTRGGIVVGPQGRESKVFDCHDGHGLRLWQRAGLKVALLSGRSSEPTEVRARQLQIEDCLQDCHDKLPVLRELVDKSGLSAKNVVYAGDDLTDLPPIRYAGFGVAVANGVDEIKRYADYVTEREGGRGAVREVVELVLKTTGRWQKLMQRYLA